LVLEQFDADGQASVRTRFADRHIRVVYLNPDRLENSNYKVIRVSLNDEELPVDTPNNSFRISRQRITALDPSQEHQITVWLAAK
jgi:hypothetical protein